MDDSLPISSLQNPRVKRAVALRRRAHRDELGLMLIEGYREIGRALDNNRRLAELFFCPELFQGSNNEALIARAREAGAALFACAPPVFEKLSYRDRPDGLLAVAPRVPKGLDALAPPQDALVVVAESIEKPGNLGTILRTSDAAGVDGVIVCDRRTDVDNPNVVRASIGTLFSVPVVEADSAQALAWLRARGVRIVAATPHADVSYSDEDMRRSTAIVVGAEQYGLSAVWLEEADARVRIPMRGQADSLNVAQAATILLFEARRQRDARSLPPDAGWRG